MTESAPPVAIPRFMQLAEMLQREILGGQYLPGDRLPTESQLARDLGVAVGTLRKALAELESRDLVERRQGSGTYAKQPDALAPAERAAVYQFFRLERLEGGGFPGAAVLAVDLVSDTAIARQLMLEEDQAHWRIRRLRTLDQQVVAAEEICISADHAATLSADELSDSLYDFYQRRFNQWILRVEDSIASAVAPDWWSGDPSGMAGHCGVVYRTAWNQRNDVAEVSTTWFNPSQCRYIARWS